MKETVNVGILGFGTVGSGTARILLENRDLLSVRAGCDVVLKWVCDKDTVTDRGVELPDGVLTDKIDNLLDDPELDIFVELIGGIEPARSFILRAIEKGKHVVTANKALLAAHGLEIFSAAAEKGVEVAFEASVGGGIPCIKGLKEGLVANHISTIIGIMNGTANYILTRMTRYGDTFQEVLKDAQRLGYAEADPTYDVEGIDTAHKLVIMSTIAFGQKVTLDQVYTEGISRITPTDIAFASELGFIVKLLAIGRLSNGQIEVRVHPTMIPEDHLLSHVQGAYNAVYFMGDAVGKVMMYGMGAGQMPTGSAVVADIVDIARNISVGSANRVPSLGMPFASLKEAEIKPMDKVICKYYFRFMVKDSPGVLSKISGVLGENGISIQSVVQKGRDSEGAVPIVMVTHEAEEARVNAALDTISHIDFVLDQPLTIRIEDLDSLEDSL